MGVAGEGRWCRKRRPEKGGEEGLGGGSREGPEGVSSGVEARGSQPRDESPPKLLLRPPGSLLLLLLLLLLLPLLLLLQLLLLLPHESLRPASTPAGDRSGGVRGVGRQEGGGEGAGEQVHFSAGQASWLS